MSNLPTYEHEEVLIEKGYKYIVGVDEVGRGCEHPSAEVLTKNGWKNHKDIDVSDFVLSYTHNGFIEWQPINCVVEKDFDGELIELKNRSIHILVTQDHYFDVLRRVFKRDKEDNNKLKMTGYTFRDRKNVLDLINNDFIPRGGKWAGKDKKYFILPAIDKLKYDHSGKDYNEKNIPMDLWAAFLGIYLAEGSCKYKSGDGYEIHISQVKGISYNKIYDLCKKLPFDIFRGKNGIIIRNKQLAHYLKKFGNCYDKFIPEYIKCLSPKLLNILIEWMILGDGSCYRGINRKKVCQYYTTSKQLKDDFEEILLKAGWTYNTNVRQPRDGCIDGRIIKKENVVPCFEIRLRRNNKASVKGLHRKLLKYSGKVFCLSLPKYHNFYVRRDGTGYFTGNSGSGPVVAAAVRIPSKALSLFIGEVNDSKKVAVKKREKLRDLIVEHCEVGIGSMDNKAIDDVNILEATKYAMLFAVSALDKRNYVLIDGKFSNMDTIDDVPCECIIKGDGKSISIAAASIVAKVYRDSIMRELHKEYPIYGWDRNKGYLSKEHIEAIKLYGPSEYHRISFNKVGK
jgi:ribonuclease HII